MPEDMILRYVPFSRGAIVVSKWKPCFTLLRLAYRMTSNGYEGVVFVEVHWAKARSPVLNSHFAYLQTGIPRRDGSSPVLAVLSKSGPGVLGGELGTASQEHRAGQGFGSLHCSSA